MKLAVGVNKLSFLDFLEMTLEELQTFFEGSQEGKLMHIDDLLLANFHLAQLIPASVWEPGKLPKEPTSLYKEYLKTSKDTTSQNVAFKFANPNAQTAEDLTPEELERVKSHAGQLHAQIFKEVAKFARDERNIVKEG